ncbi:tyrosine-type recombinase/integrase [Paenibacillus filicis]|uniref:tyrosine-type recombinase/integrase n=1 Tax=Paenibacillus filicis TaxID=669464 RepID=UPI00311929CC
MHNNDHTDPTIEDFLTYLQNSGYTIQTQRAYIREARNFLAFVRNKDATEIRKADIMRYQKEMRDRGAGDAAINRMVSAVRSYFNAQIEFERMQQNPALTVKKSKIEKNRVPVYLNEEELEDFLTSVNGIHKLRNLAICVLMAYCGLRVSEVHALNLENFNRGQRPNLQFMGKGRKWRNVPLHASVVNILDKYMHKERLEAAESDSNAFFVSQERKRVGRRTIQSVIEQTAQALKKSRPELKDKRISSHKLRHTFATTHFRHGTDLRTLQELLGHSDISTTQIYTHIENEQLIEAQERIQPKLPANY